MARGTKKRVMGVKGAIVVRRSMLRKPSLQNWVDQQFVQDPNLKARVEQMVQEMELEQELVRIRKERGLSQVTVAKLLGVSQPAVAKIESGKDKNLGVLTLAKYATALGAQIMIKFQTRNALRPAKVIGLNRKSRNSV